MPSTTFTVRVDQAANGVLAASDASNFWTAFFNAAMTHQFRL